MPMQPVYGSFDGTLRTLVADEFRPWLGRSLDRAEVGAIIRREAETKPNVFAFEIGRFGARTVDKPPEQVARPGMQVLLLRAECFRELLASAARLVDWSHDVLIGIDLGDEALQHHEAPFFSFQKKRGECNLLLPDFEFMWLAPYRATDHRDDRRFRDKSDRAVFAGSTTGGGLITMETLRGAGFPRLRAARFFRNADEVDFRLVDLVQCQDEDVREALRAEGFGPPHMTWKQMFEAKFILSMDGNGATCSRVAVALQSHSVLVKYASDNILFYSSLLVPGQHYLEVSDDRLVLDIVAVERTRPGFYASVADAGAAFSDRHLAPLPLAQYTARMLRAYDRLLSRGEGALPDAADEPV